MKKSRSRAQLDLEIDREDGMRNWSVVRFNHDHDGFTTYGNDLGNVLLSRVKPPVVPVMIYRYILLHSHTHSG